MQECRLLLLPGVNEIFLVFGIRQVDNNSRAFVQLGLHRNKTVMVTNDAEGGRHSQAATINFGGEKRLKNAIERFSSMPAPLSPNTDEGIVAWFHLPAGSCGRLFQPVCDRL